SELPPLGRTAWWTTRLRPIDRARRGSTLGQMIISVHILMNSLIVKFTVLLQTKKLSGGATEQIIDVLFAESFSRLQQRTAVSQNESIATRIQLSIVKQRRIRSVPPSDPLRLCASENECFRKVPLIRALRLRPSRFP